MPVLDTIVVEVIVRGPQGPQVPDGDKGDIQVGANGTLWLIKSNTLNALQATVTSADKGVYFTGATTAALYDLTAFMRSLSGSANASAALSSLGGAPLAGATFSGPVSFSGTTHTGIRLNNLTTTQRDALTGAAGMAIWNTTTGRMQVYTGSAWTAGMVRLDGDQMTGGLVLNLSGGATYPAAPSGTGLRLIQAPSTQAAMVIDASGAVPVLIYRTQGGTWASPAALTALQNMGGVQAVGHDGTNAGTAVRATFRFQASEAWTPSAQGTRFDLRLTPSGSTTIATRLSAEANGDITPGADNTQSLGTASLRWSNLHATNGIFTGYVRLPSYTVATVPSASTAGAGAEIYVSNESGGAVTAFSDGTNWRRVTDRAVIS